VDDIIDFVSLSDEELKTLIGELTEQEQDLSRQRRILHGKIDILRAELVLRLQREHEAGKSIITSDDVARLSEILAGKHPAAEPPEGGPTEAGK
jgi:RsiG-like